MKYYIKDNTMYIKYISAIDGKLKTLEFDVIEDKEFLKNLMSQKNESTQIFMLDDTLREKEHPTDENIEYVSIMKLTKPKKEDEKHQKYQFYKVKLDEQKARAKELETIDKAAFTEEQKKEWEKQVKDTKARIEAYENEMKKLIKTDSDILSKPKSEETLTLEKLLKGNLKDANQEAKNMIINILKGKGLSDAQIKDLMDTSKDFKEILSKITLTPDEKNNVVNEIFNMTQAYELMRINMSDLSSYIIPNYYDLTMDNIDVLKNYYNNLSELIDQSPDDRNIVYIVKNDSGFDIPAKYYVNGKITYKKIEKPDGNTDVYDLIHGTNKDLIINHKKPFRAKDYYLFVSVVRKYLNDLKDFIDYHEKRLTGGMGLKDKIKKSMTSDINKKLDTLIQNFETLKNDYINFKEEIKTKSKTVVENQRFPELREEEKPKPKEKEKENQRFPELREEEKPKTIDNMEDNDFRELIKNFSKNKLKHTEPVKYEPKEEKSKLEETFEKRRKDIEKSDDEEENDDLEWLD